MDKLERNLLKIQQYITELAQLRYVESRPLSQVWAEQQSVGNGSGWQATGSAGQSLEPGQRWAARDSLYVISFEVVIPAEWRSNKDSLIALRLDLAQSYSEHSLNSVEGLLYINGQALHAIDRYHREVILPDTLVKNHAVLNGMLKVWTGLANEFQTVNRLELSLIDQRVERLYALLKQGLGALQALPPHSPTRFGLYNALEAAVALVDFRQLAPADLAESCQTAYTRLRASWASLNQPKAADKTLAWQPHSIAVGHAHIDVAWLWQLRHTRLKAANTFATALYHIERYPYFVFLQSQPQLYQFIKEDQPELYRRIKEKVANGQWEAEGGMWVEADTNLPGGESLVRQFLYGQRFFRQEFGYTSRVLWLPDAFGYSAALPGLMRGAGIDYFVTTKISWNDTNRIPVDTFQWEGLDGSQVLGHFITTPTNEDVYFTYNGSVEPAVLAGAWQNYRQKAINTELLLAYGWGDGGGGPTREMIETAGGPLTVPLSPELPTVSTGKLVDFMERLAKRVAHNPQLPKWLGELYYENHRGVYTTQGRTKRANRQAERALHDAEWLTSLVAELTEQPYPQAELTALWPPVLTNQFHDVLPGSSIGPVYQDAERIYAQVTQTAEALISQAQVALVRQLPVRTGTVVVFNSLSWSRRDLLELPSRPSELAGLSQPLANGNQLVYVENVPALGYRAVTQAGEAPGAALIVGPDYMENQFYRLELNAAGQLSRLLDKRVAGAGEGREVLARGMPGNVFQLFEDRPLSADAWNIESFYEQKSWELAELVSREVVETGPLRAGLRQEWHYAGGRTRIVQLLYLYAHSARIDFVTHVEWQERHTLLKVAFPVNLRRSWASAEIQFGVIERPTHRNTSWDEARFETCAQKWFDLSEGDYGVAVLNDSKYGYDVHDNVMRLSLLRGPTDPDPTADLGQHEFTYSLWPHAGDWFAGGVHRAAYELNYPLRSLIVTPTRLEHQAALPLDFSLVEVTPGNVIIETVKRAEDDSNGLVLRLYECAKRRGVYRLQFPFKLAQAFETNLLEEVQQPVRLDADKQTIEGYLEPHQILTLLVYPAGYNA